MVLEAVAASGVTYQNEISRLGEDIKKLIGAAPSTAQASPSAGASPRGPPESLT